MRVFNSSLLRAAVCLLVMTTAVVCGSQTQSAPPVSLAVVPIGHAELIEDLERRAHADRQFIKLLTISLKQAGKTARADLDSGLYDALIWPTRFS